MKKQVFKINDNGIMLFDEELSISPISFDEEENPIYEIPEGYVGTPLPTDENGGQLSFYRPKWTGTEWVEDKTQAEIDELNKPFLPTDTEILGQQMTEREIESMLQGQQITDMELRMLMLEMGAS